MEKNELIPRRHISHSISPENQCTRGSRWMMKWLFICKWRHFLHTFYIQWKWTIWCDKASCQDSWPTLLALVFFLSLPLTPHWLILFRLAREGMHLMQFYVQAVSQWRVPSFCGINISFSIWMQIWDVALGILMCSTMKNNQGPVWIWFVWAQNKYGAM